MTKYSKEAWVGVFVLIGLLCVGYLTIKLGKMEFIGGDKYYTVTARFTNVSGLRVGADVEMAGVLIGRVAAIDLDQSIGVARVSLSILKTVTLTDDVIASVKTAGLIGDKYIKLSPGGSPSVLANGGEITETEPAIDIEELISKYVFGKV